MSLSIDSTLLLFLQREHGLLQGSEPVPAAALEDKLRQGKFSEDQIMRFMRDLRQTPSGQMVTGVSRYWGSRPSTRLSPGDSPFEQLVGRLWERMGDQPNFRALTDSAGAYNAGFLGQQLLEEVALVAMEVEVLQVSTGQTVLAPVSPSASINTPYVNTISADEEPEYPGNLELERRIEDMIRWNALIMAHAANNKFPGLGGHIATYASEATLVEVGLNHFFKVDDLLYPHGHASPGFYARAYLEGRLTREQLEHFRREADGLGLPSYPHPWHLRDFWQFPTVSMGLGPISAIYQARFNRYLENRGIVAEGSTGRVWAFLGDGEMDEVEARGAAHIASRDDLDNLIFVVNCNLQRLDGTVRPNGHIVQELEASFRGAGWNVIKLLWGSRWNPLFAMDSQGILARRLEEVPDGDWQTYVVRDGKYIRDHLFNTPELQSFVEGMIDEEVRELVMDRGGHDPVKVYAAYEQAYRTTGQPTIILAQTIKGYKTPMAGIMKAHQEKKVKDEDLPALRDLYGIPLSDDELKTDFPFYKPEESSPEMIYLRERRENLGGFMPARSDEATHPLEMIPKDFLVEPAAKGSGTRSISTTMALVDLMKRLMKSEQMGSRLVPIIPDEGRTFGMEELFSRGVYDPQGMNFTAADGGTLLTYKTSRTGQLLQEGISEAGAMASFIAAATSYSTHGVPMVPIYIFYSMFGIQRTGDQWWQNADARGRGFLIGATAGRTTLNGEGLQHEDGHSLLMSSVVPNLKSYDPAFGYEIAVIMEEGLRRMYVENEDIFYYVTAYNENTIQPPLPVGEGVREGILKGLYQFASANEIYANGSEDHPRTYILASGPLIQSALRAQKILAEEYGVLSDVWSATSYTELRREAMEVERWNRYHPDQPQKTAYVTRMLGDANLVVAVSDYMKAVPDQITKYIPGKMITLGTDGFGMSDTREALRDHFEIDHRYIVYSTLHGLTQEGKFDKGRLKQIMNDLKIDPKKPDPATYDPARLVVDLDEAVAANTDGADEGASGNGRGNHGRLIAGNRIVRGPAARRPVLEVVVRK